MSEKRWEEIQCGCDFRTRLVGDGCEVCNPALAEQLAEEEDEPCLCNGPGCPECNPYDEGF